MGNVDCNSLGARGSGLWLGAWDCNERDVARPAWCSFCNLPRELADWWPQPVGSRHAQRLCTRTVKTYRDLEAWQSSTTLVEEVYAFTRGFPADERFGLTSQLRRAAVSVAANIAKGSCRRTTAAYVNHVSIALGSHAEVETCSEFAMRLGNVFAGALNKLTPVLERAGPAFQRFNALPRD